MLNDEQLDWIKSSYSNGVEESCVEIAHRADGSVCVRDTKEDPATASVQVYNPGEWDAFLNGAKAGEFDRP